MEDNRYTYVAICPNHWGKSDVSSAAAIALAKSAGGSSYRKAHFTIWRIEAPINSVTINDIDGSVNYPQGAVVDKLQTSTLAKKGI